MAITYRGGKFSGTAGAGGGNIAINSGLAGGSGAAALAGDLVVITVAVGTAARNPTIAIALPPGFTPLTLNHTTASAIDISVQTCYKIMPATPDLVVQIPSSGNNADGIAWTIQVFKGVDPTTPMDVAATFATGSGTDNLPDPLTITPTTAGAWIVVCGGGAGGTGGTYTAAYLTNFLTANGADTNDASVGSGYLVAPGGAYDPAKFGGGEVNAANSWGASTLALRPLIHAGTGVLAGPGSTVAGAASSATARPSSGVLVGAQAVIAGASAHHALHAASGAMVGPGAALAGSAARTRVHEVTGELIAQGSIFVGAADRVAGHVSHDAFGALIAQGALIAGIASGQPLGAARSTAVESSGIRPSGQGGIRPGGAGGTRPGGGSGSRPTQLSTGRRKP